MCEYQYPAPILRSLASQKNRASTRSLLSAKESDDDDDA
jgi:hypothetical protein